MSQSLSATAPEPKALIPRPISALLEVELRDPGRAPRIVLWTVCALFSLLLLWEIFGKLDIVAVAEGKLVPETYTKIVQPLETGVVSEILVNEGDVVRAGQVLMRLDKTLVSAEGRSTEQELELRRAELERIDAELLNQPLKISSSSNPVVVSQVSAEYRANREALRDAVGEASATRDKAVADLAGAEETAQMLEQTLPSYEKAARAYEQLAAENLTPRLEAQEKRRDATEKVQALAAQRAIVISSNAIIDSATRKLAQATSAYRSKLESERSETLLQVKKLEQEVVVKHSYRGARTELRAPEDGIVKDLATTTLGAVVQPGTVLLTIVPKNEALLAEVSIKNEDIGFVQVGQRARVKLAAFPFQKYGMLDGTVVNVGAEASDRKASTAENNQPPPTSNLYKALIKLDTSKIREGAALLDSRTGMQLTGEIREGKRTVLEYLLSPVERISGEAGQER